MGNAPPYFLRLRIFANKIGYFYQKLRSFPPVYDSCPVRCLAKEADRENGCPDCNYTVAFQSLKKYYHKALEGEILTELEGRGLHQALIPFFLEAELKQFSFDEIYNDYLALCSIEELVGTETGDRPGGVNPKWSVRTAAGIRIIREERYKIRREESFKLDEERKARERARGK